MVGGPDTIEAPAPALTPREAPTPRGSGRGKSSWTGVVSLSLGVFAIVMAEFLPASLLPRIADDLQVSAGAAGQAVSVTAFAAALSALLIAVVLPRADRRRVMIGLTLLAAASNVIVAVSPSLVVLLAARLLLGMALGGFWAMAIAMATQLVPADHVGRALTVINAGVALATIGAVPIGAWLGDVWGWRAVFLVGAGVAVLALLVQAAVLPRVAPTAASGLRAVGAVLRSGVVRIGLLAILIAFSGHFAGFTYIRPASEHLSSIDAAQFAALLVVFGVAGFVGTALSGPFADRAPRAGVLLFPGTVGVGMLAMLVIGGSLAGLFVAVAVWGIGFGGLPTTVLSWGARVEPERPEQIGGLIVMVCNVGVAAGAITGGVLVDGVSASAPVLVGGLAAIVGAVMLFATQKSQLGPASLHE